MASDLRSETTCRPLALSVTWRRLLTNLLVRHTVPIRFRAALRSSSCASTMLSVARNVYRPTLTRAFATPSRRAFKHTLPDLPYAYNVSSVSTFLESCR